MKHGYHPLTKSAFGNYAETREPEDIELFEMADPSIELEANVSKTTATATQFADGIENMEKRNASGSGSSRERASYTSDEIVLARFGKKQKLKRRFKSISTVGLTCGIMLTWMAVSGALQFGLLNGGPAGMIWGFVGAFVGAMLQSLVMAEIASMIPLAGGAFNWVAFLAPPQYRKFLSYIAGWLTVITYQVFVLQVCYASASVVQGLIILTTPSYTPQLWHATLMSYGVSFFGFFVNTYLGRVLPQVESFLLFLIVMGYIGILIPLVYLGPHRSAAEVFGTFLNLGGWENDGVAFLVGWTGAVGAFIGADGADHIAEEIENAATVIPFSMWFSTLTNGIIAFGMLVALLFATQDFAAATESATGWAFIDIYHGAVGSTRGATAMVAVYVVINIMSITSLMATASRALWAFARENGVPFSSFMSKVDPRTRLPYNAVAMTVVTQIILALISVGSSTAFQAFYSVETSVYYSTYLVAACVMLHKRLTTPASEIPWGPFQLGKWGVPITIITIIYTVVTLIFSFFPLMLPVTPSNMNYSILIYGAAVLLMLGFWVVHGRHVYVGPIWELDGDHVRRK